MPSTVLALLAIAPAAAILAYYLRIVRRAPEPWLRVAATCVLGGAIVYVAGPLERQATAFVTRDAPWVWSFAVVAPTEELLKLAVMLIAAPWPTRYERVSSGLTYGIAAGVGFACVENLHYVFAYGAEAGVFRAVTAVPAHALESAIVGLGLGVVHRFGRWRSVVVAAIAAILLHGAYDGVLLGAPSLRGLVVGIVFFEAVVVRFAVRSVLERDLQRDMDLLASVPLFDGVTSSALRVLAAGSTRVRVAKGTPVVRVGNRGDAMFQIVRGEVDVWVDDEVVRKLGAGDFFGELALLRDAPRSADVIASSDALVMRVDRRVFSSAVRGDEVFAQLVLDRARERFDADELPDLETLQRRARSEVERGATGAVAAALSSSPIFAGLSTDDVESLANASMHVHRGTNTKLLRSGHAGHGLYVLLSGQAVATLGARHLTLLVEGDFFGEISLLTGWAATASVTSTTPVELALLRWVDLEPVVAKNPALGLRLLEALEVRAARGLDAPAETTSLRDTLGRALVRATGALSPWSARAEAVYQAHPDLRSLPRSTVETLAEHDTPDGLAGAALEDAIARCPSVLRFYGRLAIRRARP